MLMGLTTANYCALSLRGKLQQWLSISSLLTQTVFQLKFQLDSPPQFTCPLLTCRCEGTQCKVSSNRD